MPNNLDFRLILRVGHKCLKQSLDGPNCVHINHRPAFDHPFLKNHTIQVIIWVFSMINFRSGDAALQDGDKKNRGNGSHDSF